MQKRVCVINCKMEGLDTEQDKISDQMAFEDTKEKTLRALTIPREIPCRTSQNIKNYVIENGKMNENEKKNEKMNKK